MAENTWLSRFPSGARNRAIGGLSRYLHVSRVRSVYIVLGTTAGLLVTIGLCIYVFWIRRTYVLKQDVMTLKRRRVVAHAGRNASLITAPLLIFRFCDLSVESCKKAPFSSCELVSFVDYLSALRVPGGFNWQRAIRTLLVDRRLDVLLPLTEFLPMQSRLADPFAQVGGQRKVYRMLREAFSPLHLAAIGELINLAAVEDEAEQASATEASTGLLCVLEPSEHRPARLSCMRTYMLGERAKFLPDDVARLPDDVILDEQMPKLLEGLDPEGPVATVQPTTGAVWLPDVSFSHAGRAFRLNVWGERCGVVFAVLLNRLSANMVPDVWRDLSMRGKRTTLRLTAGEEAISSPGELVAALQKRLSSSFSMQIVSRTASFGLGCAVKQDDQWLQMPLVMPLRTGVCMLNNKKARSSGTKEITSLMPHSEVALRVSSPGQFSFRVAWFQGVEGFTGWHSGNEAVLPWNNSADVEVLHSSWLPPQCSAAADLAAVIACATNRMADVNQMPAGGYGYYGVCLDSVAAVQAAMQQPVTVFPCMLSGQPKAQLALAYMEIKNQMHDNGAEGKRVAELADECRRGVLNVPCDIQHEPSHIPNAIRRIQACMPPVSPYETLECARVDLRVAAEQYQEQDAWSDVLEFSQGLSTPRTRNF